MTYFKKFVVFIVLLILMVGLSSTSIMAQDSSEIPLDQLRTPTELQDIINTFDRLDYNFSSFNEGEEVQELRIKFQYQGKENVDDVQADKISIEILTGGSSQDSQMTFWVNEGEIVRMAQNEQEIPAAMAETMKDQILQSVFFPFYQFEELNLEEIASEGEVTRTQEMISGREIDIIKIESDNLAQSGMESGTVKVANFDEFMMTMGFSYITLEEAETDYDEVKFEVTEIELR